MKYILTFVACICLSTQLWAKAEVGQPAPPAEGKLMDGREFSLDRLKGQVVLLHFWASWCEPCQEEMPLMDAFYKAHKKDGFEIIAISVDRPSDIDTMKHMAHHFSFPNTHKDQVNVKGYGKIWRIPSTFVIDRKGILVKDGLQGDPKIDAALFNNVVLPLLKN